MPAAWPVAKTVRKTSQDVAHPEDLEADLAFVRRLLDGAIPSYRMEKRHFDRDGNVVWVLSSVSLVRTADGSPSYFINQIEDITERKHAEADRDRLRDELHHAHKLEAIGRLAAGVAHDFNNMLTAIEGYSELLLNKLDPQTPEHAHALQIRRAAEQAATLPRQLLAFGRRQALTPEVVDLRAVVDNIDDSSGASSAHVSDSKQPQRVRPLPMSTQTSWSKPSSTSS